MVLKEKRFRPPKRHHLHGDPRRTWPSLEKLIAQQEAHYQNGSAEEVPPEEPAWADYNLIRPFYRADKLVEPLDEKVAAYAFPPVDPPPLDPLKTQRPVKLPETRLPEGTHRHQPPRDWNTQYEAHQRRRSQRPLEDPFTEEGARLFAWAYYRLQRLAVKIQEEINRKQKEIARLEVELDGKAEEETDKQTTEKPMNDQDRNEEKSIVPQRQDTPLHVDRRHAHADEGMAPLKELEASTKAPGRGPP